jgi:outer membrane protein
MAGHFLRIQDSTVGRGMPWPTGGPAGTAAPAPSFPLSGLAFFCYKHPVVCRRANGIPALAPKRGGEGMKKCLWPLFAACILLILAPVAMAAAPGPVRIGIVDTQKIMRDSKAAKEARDSFLKERGAKQAIFAGQEKEVLKLQDELKNMDAKAPADARKAKAEKLGQEIKELKRLKDDIEEELKRKEVELTSKILRDVHRLVVDYRKKEGLTVVLQKSAVIDYDSAVDITDRIIKIYDIYAGMKK